MDNNAEPAWLLIGALLGAQVATSCRVRGDCVETPPATHGSAGLREAMALVAAGIDVNLPDSGGESPLHAAIRRREADTVEYLLEHGADPNRMNLFGYVALDVASQAGVQPGSSIFVQLAARGGRWNVFKE